MRLQKIQTTLLSSVRRIESRAYQNGNDDTVFGGLGRDVIVGGAGNDMLDGDEADDLVFGDQIFLNRRIVETGNTDITTPGTITSGRFQTLCGTQIYSRTDTAVLVGNQYLDQCGGAVNADNSGVLLTNGIAQDFRDPDSGPGGTNIDAFPWWAEYSANFSDGKPDSHFHDFVADSGFKGAGSFGNDYLAGGQSNDLLFGQLGNDVIQGDGGIDLAFARPIDNAGETVLITRVVTIHVSASRTPDGCGPFDPTRTDTHVGTCDLVGDLDLVAVVRRPPPPTVRTTSKVAAATTSCSGASARTTSSVAAPTSSRSTRRRSGPTVPTSCSAMTG